MSTTQDSELKVSNKFVDDINFFDNNDNNNNNIQMIVSKSDLIVLDNVLSQKECENIIEYYELDGFEQYKKSDRYKNLCNMPTLTKTISKRCIFNYSECCR